MGKKDNKYSNAATSLSEGGIFGLGRPIDFTDGITRIALICTILTSVAATVWKTMGGADTETAMYFGLNTAAAFFFSWLIAQELDPDRKLGSCSAVAAVYPADAKPYFRFAAQDRG